MTEQYKMFSDKEAKGLGKKFIVYVCASFICMYLDDSIFDTKYNSHINIFK